jgi:hypothetical protein
VIATFVEPSGIAISTLTPRRVLVVRPMRSRDWALETPPWNQS